MAKGLQRVLDSCENQNPHFEIQIALLNLNKVLRLLVPECVVTICQQTHKLYSIQHANLQSSSLISSDVVVDTHVSN